MLKRNPNRATGCCPIAFGSQCHSQSFDEGELVRGPVVATFATTAADGKCYQVDYFNLDVIIAKLDDFLKLSRQELLTHAGAISHEQAEERAQIEYEKHRALQINQPSPVEKHFDQAVKKLPKSGTGSREVAKNANKGKNS